jgi:hypothetical protein
MSPSALYPTENGSATVDFPKSKIITPLVSHATARGWPSHLTCALSWSGSDFVNEQRFVYELSKEDTVEIENALSYFKGKTNSSLMVVFITNLSGLELDGSEVMASNFPLPDLHDKLIQLAADLHDGKGFFILRGLNPSNYSPEDNIVIFLGLSSYIAETRGKQDEAGNMLCEPLWSRSLV